MLNIAICDDEPVVCDLLQQKVSRLMQDLTQPVRVSCCSSPEQLMASGVNCDILLLDIQMPGCNGMELARRLRRMGRSCAIIFITVCQEAVFDAFEVDAVDYLCKPVDDGRFQHALRRAVRRVKGPLEPALFVQTLNWCKSVKLSSIYYCEVINRKVYLHTTGGVITYYSKLEALEQQLDDRFLKCHRSYLVNLDHLSEYANGEITLENGDRVPVPRARQRDVMSGMLQYMKKREEALW